MGSSWTATRNQRRVENNDKIGNERELFYPPDEGIDPEAELISATSSGRLESVLTAWITPLNETKVHDSGTDGHCVLHIHHGKSLDACILLLHCVYGAQGGVNGPTQLRSTAQSPVLTAWITPLDETKVHDSGADGHCVLHMHHGKSLDACILLLHCVYGAQGGVNCIMASLSTLAYCSCTAFMVLRAE